MEVVTLLFVSMQLNESMISETMREVEIKEKYDKANKLWEEYQNHELRNGGSLLELNEDEIREKIVVKLIVET